MKYLQLIALIIPVHILCMENFNSEKTRLEDLPQKICKEASLTARCLALCAKTFVDKENTENFNKEPFKKLPKELYDNIKILKKSLNAFNELKMVNDSIGEPLVIDPLLIEAFILITGGQSKLHNNLQQLMKYPSTENSVKSLSYFFEHHKCDVNAKLGDHTPLSWAAFAAKPDAVKWLLDHGAANKSDDLGFPLHLAVYDGLNPIDVKGRIKTIECFIDHKFDLNCLNPWNKTPLDIAIRENQEAVIKLLREHGALTYEELKAHIKKQNKDKEPELLAYAAVGNNEGISLLLKDGVNINCVDEAGNTPLILAVQNGYKKTVKQLLQFGASIEIKNRYNQTAYDVAIEENQAEIAELLKPINQDIYVYGILRGGFFMD